MKPTILFALLAVVLGCSHETSFVRSDTVLGRVVIYRNGVAYFERAATVAENNLKLSVPADKVDDFLRSLTVVDAETGEPTPVSYPTQPTLEGGTGLIDMEIGLSGAGPHKLKLSYVTESPSWKPSYRLVLGTPGKVEIQGWAVVDNTSGEDWNRVKLGVGASSAMSFRYDLHSIRNVTRETLRTNDLFAQAPPTGSSTYGQAGAAPVVAELSDDSLMAEERAAAERESKKDYVAEMQSAPSPSMAMSAPARSSGYGGGSGKKAKGSPAKSAPMEAMPPPPPPVKPRSFQESRMLDMTRRLQSTRDQIVVEGFADAKDKDQNAASLDRANRMREQLVRNGVPPERVVAVGRGLQTGHNGGVRVVETPTPPAAKPKTETDAAVAAAQDPIGTAHFESTTAMNVPRGSSAMVSILKTEAQGDVVYLYDHESSRGNEVFPFKSIRLLNPTDSVLESGPVTVFGAGRFIGEGLVEPIPARSVAFVPYALDRQIVVERKHEDRDEIARIITVQRGVFSTEAKHIRRMTFILNNRLDDKAVVFVRHTVQPGFKLTRSPATSERMGTAHLFRIEIEAKGKAEVAIEETTPVFKTTDIRAPEGMEMIRAYISSATVSSIIREKVSELLKLQKETTDTDQQIATTRDQLQEYRNRMDELHAQIVTLTAVKTGAGLLKDLEKKMQDISQKVSQGTLRLVNLQEKLMIARIHFQDAVAELSLEDKKADAQPAASSEPAPPAAPAEKAKKAKKPK
jgi:hypothetical protein